MSERGADFLLGWVESHIRPGDFPAEGDKAEARVKAEECLAAAAADGISRAEIEAEVGPVETYMNVMMSTPPEAKVDVELFAIDDDKPDGKAAPT